MKASYDGAEAAYGPEDTTNVFMDWQQPDTSVASRIKLKSLLLGMHNYADSRGYLPVNTVYGLDLSTQRSYLSWRVHLLPFLGHADLFNRFHLDEPWNSPHNMTLLDKMPEVFRSRGLSASSTKTGFKVLIIPVPTATPSPEVHRRRSTVRPCELCRRHRPEPFL